MIFIAEYNDNVLLRRIGNKLGRTVKVDVATEEACRENMPD